MDHRLVLTHPDDVSWHADANYSQSIAASLIQAYAFLRTSQGSKASYLQSAQQLEYLHDAQMSPRQRVRVFFVLGSAYAANCDYEHALAWYDRALQVAATSHQFGNMCELLILRASINRAKLQFANASDDLWACYDLLLRRAAQPNLVGADIQLQIFAQLAGYEYFLGNFETAEQLIQEGRSLFPLTPQSRLDAATLMWAEALLCRQKNNFAQALDLGLEVCSVYAVEASPISRDRLHIFVANTTLDVAEKLMGISAFADMQSLLTLASSHLKQATALVDVSKDAAGNGLAQLAQARYARLVNANVDRIGAMESVIHLGRRLDDVALVGQAFTALGDELTARSESTLACAYYRQALDILNPSDMAALMIPPGRALLLAQEMSVK